MQKKNHIPVITAKMSSERAKGLAWYLILILFVLAVAANVGVLYMSPSLNFYALVGINVIFILLFIALYPLFVSFKDIKKGKKNK